MSDRVREARRRLVTTLALVAVVAPLALAAARWPSYWSWIAPEQTPMTWLQSVVLVLGAAAALLVHLLLGLHGAGRRDRVAWFVLAGGFAALAVDERFALHERVRDRVLAPRDVTLPLLPWVAPGDFLVLLVALGGLALLPLVLRAFAPDRPARALLLAGVALAVVAVATDSVDPSTWSVPAERVQQSLEEVAELAAALCLLGAVALRLLGVLAPADPAPALPEPTAEAARAALVGERAGRRGR